MRSRLTHIRITVQTIIANGDGTNVDFEKGKVSLFNNSYDHDDELVILVDLWNIWQRTAAEGSLAKVSSFVTLASVRTCSLCWNQPLKSATHLNLNHHHHNLHHHNHHLYLYFHLHHHHNRRQNHI